MPLVAFGTCLRLNVDRRVTAVRGCAAQGLCKACTQAGWDVPALSTKGLFSPASCSHGKQGMERHSQKSQLSSIPARMVQQLPVLQPSPELCLWYGLCQALLASCRAGQATPLCNPVVLPPPCSASWHQVWVSQPRCPRDSQPRVQGFPASHARQRERKKKDEFLLRTLGRHKQGKPGKYLPGSSLSEGAEWPAPVLRPGF